LTPILIFFVVGIVANEDLSLSLSLSLPESDDSSLPSNEKITRKKENNFSYQDVFLKKIKGTM
jgi:hypothetical protein